LQDHVSLAPPRVAAAPKQPIAAAGPATAPIPNSTPNRRGLFGKRGAAEPPPEPAKAEVAEKPDKPGMLERMKSWLPQNPFR